MKLINKVFVSTLIFCFFLLFIVSCEKESIKLDHQIDTRELQLSENRSSSTIDSLFRVQLNNLADMFYIADSTSNGDLAILLESLDTLSTSEAFAVLDSSGLINVTQLENAIYQTSYYENLLLESQSNEDVQSIVNQEVIDLQGLFARPFWGKDDCEHVGEPFFGVSDAPCYINTRCRRYRLWIGWGYVAGPVEAVDCP